MRLDQLHSFSVLPGQKLRDPYGRVIKKLRVSLLDVCNFRCFYCMPEQPKFLHSKNWLRPSEIEAICSTLVDFGLSEIRLTGGEPTLRPDLKDIVDRLSDLEISKLGITTNGATLQKYLGFLSKTKCKSLNISLDSLDRRTFNKVTRTDAFDRVVASILDAHQMGFQVKLNTVLMRGVNDHEIMDFLEFSALHGIEIRFLELMKIGQVSKFNRNLFISADEIISRVREAETLKPIEMPLDSTSFNFVTQSGAKIGFIASESKPFCTNCSRWRLSAKGFLRACLMSPAGVNLREVDIEDYPRKLRTLLGLKPVGRLSHIEQDMHQIGG